jgi:hypothetical protein
MMRQSLLDHSAAYDLSILERITVWVSKETSTRGQVSLVTGSRVDLELG